MEDDAIREQQIELCLIFSQTKQQKAKLHYFDNI